MNGTFVDTNVLVYTRDSTEPIKQSMCRGWMEHLWATRRGRVSIQVLNEYYVTVTRKLAPARPAEDAQSDVSDLRSWRPVVLDGDLVTSAWAIERRHRLSFWDSLVVAAAKAARCDRLLTEDLQDGQDIDGVVVTNPFTNAPNEPG